MAVSCDTRLLCSLRALPQTMASMTAARIRNYIDLLPHIHHGSPPAFVEFLHASPHLRHPRRKPSPPPRHPVSRDVPEKMTHPLPEFCLQSYTLLPNLVQNLVGRTSYSFFFSISPAIPRSIIVIIHIITSP